MNSITKSLTKLFTRDLDRLEKEILTYPNDELVWIIKGEIKNSAGNLCLHICGNLQHYIGAVLGNSRYERAREDEFSMKGLSKDYLLREIQNTKQILKTTLSLITTEILEASYPEVVFDEPMSTQHFLIHLQGHLNYHLGQINYHRRLIE